MRDHIQLYKIYFVVALSVVIGFPVDAAESSSTGSTYNELVAMQSLVIKDPVMALSRLKEIEPEKNDGDLYLLWLLRHAEALNYSYRFAEFEKAINVGLESINTNTAPEISSAYIMHEGIIAQREGDFRQAAARLKVAIQVAEKVKHRYVQVYGLSELAFTHSLEEQFESSLLALQEAFLISSNENDPFLSAVVHEVYGALYAYMEKYEDSIKHYTKARQLYAELAYPYYMGESAFGMATTYRNWQKWDMAIEWYERYQDSLTSIESEYTRFFYHYGVGMTYARSQNCAKAVPVMRKALIAKEFKDYRAEVYKSIARCYARINDFESADRAIADARSIFAEIPELKGTSWELETDKVAAEVLAMQGKHGEAYDLLDSYYQNIMLINKKNTSDRLEKLKLSLELEREAMELVVLENKSKVQQLMLNNQVRKIQVQRLWLFGSIAFILIILGFLWWQLRISYKLKSLAITDELTGLSNRRYIFSAIERILLNKSGKSFHHSLMLIDVDDLKPINDQYGHQVGDKVLRMVAKAGRKVSRDSDVFARIGGDEYMLLMTRTDKSLETAVANRIIDSISETPIVTDSGDKLNISVSIGITSIEGQQESPETVYTRVDEALYRAKSKGRNGYSR